VKVSDLQGKNMRKIVKSFILIIIILSVQGCFFIYLPGSVVGGIKDTLTGDEGDHCVNTTTKAGDRIFTQGGNVWVVKSLSGTSNRCSDPRLPIRALLLTQQEYNQSLATEANKKNEPQNDEWD